MVTRYKPFINVGPGEVIKEELEALNWTQEDLAREIGVSLSTVQRWERQGGEPTRLARRELQKLFDECGIDGHAS